MIDNRTALRAAAPGLAIALAVLIAAVIALACAPSAHAAKFCAEDDPCWTWSTMGNLDRGVYVKGRRFRVVTPCQFATLAELSLIDWKRTAHLRGDAYARANGCRDDLYA